MPEVGATVVKDPDAALIYGIEWSQYLPDEATISSSTWVISEGDDDDLEASSPAVAGTRTSVKLSGGTLAQLYRVTNRIVYGSPSQTEDRSFFVRIRER